MLKKKNKSAMRRENCIFIIVYSHIKWSYKSHIKYPHKYVRVVQVVQVTRMIQVDEVDYGQTGGLRVTYILQNVIHH